MVKLLNSVSLLLLLSFVSNFSFSWAIISFTGVEIGVIRAVRFKAFTAAYYLGVMYNSFNENTPITLVNPTRKFTTEFFVYLWSNNTLDIFRAPGSGRNTDRSLGLEGLPVIGTADLFGSGESMVLQTFHLGRPPTFEFHRVDTSDAMILYSRSSSNCLGLDGGFGPFINKKCERFYLEMVDCLGGSFKTTTWNRFMWSPPAKFWLFEFYITKEFCFAILPNVLEEVAGYCGTINAGVQCFTEKPNIAYKWRTYLDVGVPSVKMYIWDEELPPLIAQALNCSKKFYGV